MKPDSEAMAINTARKTSPLGDDLYLVEMTARLQKLRSLMGEKETRKGRPKRWKNRVKFGG